MLVILFFNILWTHGTSEEPNPLLKHVWAGAADDSSQSSAVALVCCGRGSLLPCLHGPPGLPSHPAAGAPVQLRVPTQLPAA